MSETKWTEGEWHVVGGGPHWNNPDIPNHRIASSCTTTRAFDVAWSEDGELVAEHVYEEADARLMASAKELYQMLAWFAYPGPSEDRPSDEDLRAMARAILAKARGEQP